MATRVAFANSFRRVVRSGVHQALDFAEGRERGAVASTIFVSAERAEENHWSSWFGEAVSGGGGMNQFLSLSVRPGQLASGHRGLGLSLWGEGGRRDIRIGSWSDPVEGRDYASHESKAGNICGLAKAMSMVLGLWVPLKGNQV